MPKKESKKEEVSEPVEVTLTEKQELEVVLKFLKDRGFNSIGDVENKIARL